MVEAVYVGGVASSSPELSKWMLNDADILLKVKRILEGYDFGINDAGEAVFTKGSGKVYSAKLINFVLFSLSQALNKNLKLSNYHDKEIAAVGWGMSDGFMKNLWLNMKEFEIDSNDIAYLGEMYRNYVDPGLRRAWKESDKRFLKETHSEQTIRQQQDISQTESKAGILSSIFGGKR